MESDGKVLFKYPVRYYAWHNRHYIVDGDGYQVMECTVIRASLEAWVLLRERMERICTLLNLNEVSKVVFPAPESQPSIPDIINMTKDVVGVMPIEYGNDFPVEKRGRGRPKGLKDSKPRKRWRWRRKKKEKAVEIPVSSDVVDVIS